MSRYQEAFRGVGRAELEGLAAQYLEQLTAVQTRCTELKLELRAYRASGLCLPGWWCPCEATATALGIFNGSAREPVTHCRVCGRPRPA